MLFLCRIAWLFLGSMDPPCGLISYPIWLALHQLHSLFLMFFGLCDPQFSSPPSMTIVSDLMWVWLPLVFLLLHTNTSVPTLKTWSSTQLLPSFSVNQTSWALSIHHEIFWVLCFLLSPSFCHLPPTSNLHPPKSSDNRISSLPGHSATGSPAGLSICPSKDTSDYQLTCQLIIRTPLPDTHLRYTSFWTLCIPLHHNKTVTNNKLSDFGS